MYIDRNKTWNTDIFEHSGKIHFDIILLFNNFPWIKLFGLIIKWQTLKYFIFAHNLIFLLAIRWYSRLLEYTISQYILSGMDKFIRPHRHMSTKGNGFKTDSVRCRHSLELCISNTGWCLEGMSLDSINRNTANFSRPLRRYRSI